MHEHLRRIWQQGKRYFVGNAITKFRRKALFRRQQGLRNAITDSNFCLTADGEIEKVRRSLLAEGPSSSMQAAHVGTLRRQGQVTTKSLLRASEHAILWSCLRKKPTSTSTTNLATRKPLFRGKSLPEMQLPARTCVSQCMGKPSRDSHFRCRRSLILGTGRPKWGSQKQRTRKESHGAESSLISSPGYCKGLVSEPAAY